MSAYKKPPGDLCIFLRYALALFMVQNTILGLILGFRSANERRRYMVTPSLIGWVQT